MNSPIEASIRVVVVDDDRLLRESIGHLLDALPDIDVVGLAGGGRNAVERCVELRPHVLVTDVRPPNHGGLSAVAELREVMPALRVITLTALGAHDYLFEALHLGVTGYLVKGCSSDELVGAVRIVAQGDAVLAPSISRGLVEHFANPSTTAADLARSYQLTGREIQVLIELGTGATNSEIADRLGMNASTVKSHVSHLLLKLGCETRVQAVIFAFDKGILIPRHAHRPSR